MISKTKDGPLMTLYWHDGKESHFSSLLVFTGCRTSCSCYRLSHLEMCACVMFSANNGDMLPCLDKYGLCWHDITACTIYTAVQLILLLDSVYVVSTSTTVFAMQSFCVYTW